MTGAADAASSRPESDSLGSVEVPRAALWGAQTQRSLLYFDIGEQRMPLALIRAIAQVKRAAAEVNASHGLLDPAKALAIADAADEVCAGQHDQQFPLSLWQTGSGTQSHMNVNEVLASLASLALGGGLGAERSVDPHDDVNRSQSSNDVFPTAMHLAAAQALAPLRVALQGLRRSLQGRARAWTDVVKIGRTHLQDATPITLGQAFEAYDAQLAAGEAALALAEPGLHALAIGGTAVGNGMGAPAGFGEQVVRLLARRLQLPLTVAGNRLAATAGHEALVALHAALRLLAVALTKLGGDLRLMGSGPRAGFGELELPANEPGSSMMPGKVNPTQVEALLMVCQQVMGHDVAIGIAAGQGQLELNTCKPLIAADVLDSQRLLTDAMNSLTVHCIDGLVARVPVLRQQVDRSLMLVTALAPHIGHAAAARIARHAQSEGLDLREAALALDAVSAADFDAWVDPLRMLGPEGGPVSPAPHP